LNVCGPIKLNVAIEVPQPLPVSPASATIVQLKSEEPQSDETTLKAPGGGDIQNRPNSIATHRSCNLF